MQRRLTWFACLVAMFIGVSSRALAQQNGDDAMYTKLNTMIAQHQGKVALSLIQWHVAPLRLQYSGRVGTRAGRTRVGDQRVGPGALTGASRT